MRPGLGPTWDDDDVFKYAVRESSPVLVPGVSMPRVKDDVAVVHNAFGRQYPTRDNTDEVMKSMARRVRSLLRRYDPVDDPGP